MRELKALGVDVNFEQEKIHRLDPNSQMTIEIYCALAQQGSESKSMTSNGELIKVLKMAHPATQILPATVIEVMKNLYLSLNLKMLILCDEFSTCVCGGYSYGKILRALDYR